VTAVLIVWVGICAAAFTWLQARGSALRVQHPVAVVALVAVLARVVPLLVLREPRGLLAVDILDYRIVADAVLRHHDVYAINETPLPIHPYIPLQMYVFAGCLKLAELAGLSFFVLVRLPIVAADAVTAAVIYRGLARAGHAALRDALSYAVCPFVILVTSYHGQFDAISTMLVCLAWYSFEKPGRRRRDVLACGMLLGLAVADKSWPVVLLPVFLLHLPAWRDRIAFVASAAAIPVFAVGAYLIAFPASVDALRERTTGYNAPLMDGQTFVIDRLATGLPGVSSFLSWEIDHGAVMLGVGVVLGIIAARRLDLATGMVAMVAAVLVTTTSGGPNHGLWIVPIALLARERAGFLVFSSIAGIHYVLIAFMLCGLSCGSAHVPGSGDLWLNALTCVTVLEWMILAAWLVKLMFPAATNRWQRAVTGHGASYAALRTGASVSPPMLSCR
jgi:hypothetical protein